MDKATAQLKRQIRKLTEKADIDTIMGLMGQVKQDIEQEMAYDAIFSDHDTALNWFIMFCEEHELQLVEKYTDGPDKCRYDIDGWADYHNAPYFMLWLNPDDKPHIELSYDGYVGVLMGCNGNLETLRQQMKKVVDLRNKG